MKVKVKKSYWSSKAYNITQRDRIRNLFKRKNKKSNKKIYATRAKSPYAKKQPYEIKLPNTMIFPNNIRDCDKFITECQQAHLQYKISINLRGLEEIDNTSILLLTANINDIFNKLYRHKKLAPCKNIDKRLATIGFWDVLCVNPPQYEEDTYFLKIKALSGIQIPDNGFHQEIINFFAQAHGIDFQYKDGLFDAVFEACANSFEHAYSEDNTNKRIWFLGSYDKDKNELEFIFYDIGMGIFKSLESKNNYFSKLIGRYIRILGKSETLKKLCTTNLSKYKKDKNKTSRGSGMISFKKIIDTISSTREANLQVITEDLFYSSYNGKTTRISKPIKGTLIRWTIGGNK